MLKKIFISAVLLIAVLSFIISLLKGNNSSDNSGVQLRSYVAVIDISGTITSGTVDDTLLGSQVSSGGSDSIMRQIRAAADDNNAKALVLRINSPGGSVTAAEEIGRELTRYKEKTGRPIIASLGDMGASAAYWIAACKSDKIYANASTLTGSIGVYLPYMNTEELYKKIGLQTDKIKSGIHKDILSPDRPMTPEEKAILQNMVNEMYGQFLDVVAQGRKMDRDRVRTLADGRVYTGRQAKELGLIDELGNYYDALTEAGHLTGLGDNPTTKTVEGRSRWRTLLDADLQKWLRFEARELLQDKALNTSGLSGPKG